MLYNTKYRNPVVFSVNNNPSIDKYIPAVHPKEHIPTNIPNINAAGTDAFSIKLVIVCLLVWGIPKLIHLFGKKYCFKLIIPKTNTSNAATFAAKWGSVNTIALNIPKPINK